MTGRTEPRSVSRMRGAPIFGTEGRSTTARAARAGAKASGRPRRLRSALQQRILHPPSTLPAQLAGGVAFALAGVGIRLGLTPLLREMTPFIAFFPAVLAASVFVGTRGGLACIAACIAISAWLFLAAPGNEWRPGIGAVPLIIFIASAGATVALTALLRDTLGEVTRAGERQSVLLAELQHRVKNTLAVVQALSEQTRRAQPHPTLFHEDFSARLIALAGAHNLLSEAGWETVSLEHVVDRALAPFMEAAPRIHRGGPPVELDSARAIHLALCLHELATNALKHGALSTADGVVQIAWTIPDATTPLVDIAWIERGGPPVPASPSRTGFGLRLLRQPTPAGATPELRFEPMGLQWSARVSLT